MDASTDLRRLLDEGPPISAVFVDVENMAVDRERGLMDFDITRVMQRIHALSRPVIRRAYADWFKLRTMRAPFLRAGFDQVQTTYINRSKNSLDMQLSVDAMETLVTSPDVRVIFLLTADSDFSALSRGLRRHNRMVIGIGWEEKTNLIFRNNCDQFLAYESLPPADPDPAEAGAGPGESPGRPGRPGRGDGRSDGSGRERPARGERSSARASGGARPPVAEPVPVIDDLGDEDGGVADAEVAFEAGSGGVARSAPPRGPAPSRPLDALDGAVARLVLEFGRGAVLPPRILIGSLRRQAGGLDPRSFGLRGFGQLIEAHPLLTRIAPGGDFRLPLELSLAMLGPAPAADPQEAQAQAVEALGQPPIGFLGRDRQYRILRTLHRAYSARNEPFTREDLIKVAADALEGVTAEQVAAVDRIVWHAKSFAVVDRRNARDPVGWLVRLREDFREFDALQFQHDSQLVREGLLAGVVLDSRGWARLIDGDDIDAADFAEILLELGFDDPAFALDDDGDDDEDDVEGDAGDREGDGQASDRAPASAPAPAMPPVPMAVGHRPARPSHVPQSPRFSRAYGRTT